MLPKNITCQVLYSVQETGLFDVKEQIRKSQLTIV